MTTAAEIYQYLNEIAPFHTAMDFDNVGLLVGDPGAAVDSVLVSLDITTPVIEQACELGAQLIISHHPVIFAPLKRLRPKDIPAQLIEHHLAAVCAHTNLDLATCGVNTQLAAALSLQDCKPVKTYRDTGLAEALFGTLPQALSPEDFAQYVKERLHCGGVKYTKGDRPVRTVGVSCGAGSGLLFDAAACGVDAFVTGESKHHEHLAACETGITMVDAGHFNTEDVVVEPLIRMLQTQFPQVAFCKSGQADPVCYLV